MTGLRNAAKLLFQTIEKCQRDRTPMLAAGLSFYTMLSLAPALWIIFAAAGAFIGRDSAREAVLDWTARNIGYNASLYVGDIVSQVKESSRLATIGGAVAVFLASTAAFGALQDSLNRIWHQQETREGSVLTQIKNFTRGFFVRRAVAFLLILLLGGLLMLSLLASTAITFLGRYLPANLPASIELLEAIDVAASILLMMLLFGTLYHLLHRKAFKRSGIWLGAFLTAALFALGKTLLSRYLGSAGLRSAYGAAGSFVLLLLWIYYSAQILLFGAEFTEVYSRQQDTQRTRQ